MKIFFRNLNKRRLQAKNKYRDLFYLADWLAPSLHGKLQLRKILVFTREYYDKYKSRCYFSLIVCPTQYEIS